MPPVTTGTRPAASAASMAGCATAANEAAVDASVSARSPTAWCGTSATRRPAGCRPRSRGPGIARTGRPGRSRRPGRGRRRGPARSCRTPWARPARGPGGGPRARRGRGRPGGRAELHARERRGGRAVDPHRRERARGGVAGEVDRDVLAQAAAQPRRVGARRALHQHLALRADEPRGALGRGALHHLDEAGDALALHVRRDVVGQALRRLRSRPGRIEERVGAVVAALLHQAEGLGEVVLGLPREPDDQVGGERQVGDRVAQPRHQVQITLAAVGAPHRLEHAGAAGLGRQVEMLAPPPGTRPSRR